MLFRRRKPQTLRAKLRTAFWPRRSWRRSMRYVRGRVLRLHATPHAIAGGLAAGVFASFTPFVGFHFLIAFAIAFLIAGNLAAAGIGCLVGNPLTFPAIWAATFEVGRSLLPDDPAGAAAPLGLAHALTNLDFAALWRPIVRPMLVGSLPLGLGFACLSYGLVYVAAVAFQRRRAQRLEIRRLQRPAAPSPAARP